MSAPLCIYYRLYDLKKSVQLIVAYPPFAFEDELKEKTDRLNALNIELNLDEKDTPVLDTEPDHSEEQPERKNADRER